MHPPPAWYATGLRWIAALLAGLADRIEPREVGALEQAPVDVSADDFLLEARLRASRAV